jgi:hypothetical protein
MNTWLVCLRQTPSPFIGVARSLKYAIDSYRVPGKFIEDRIGEAACQTSTIRLVDHGAGLWVTTDSLQAGFDTGQELFPQTDTAILLPRVHFGDISFNLRSEEQINGHNDCVPAS